jgi:carbon monoxide dehydrogenase subunit G
MAIRLENAFSVDAPPEQAWPLLLDMPVVVSCMPGAELLETIDEDHWRASVSVKLGPIGLVFDAELERELVDPTSRRMVMTSKARERKGRGGATARVESMLEPEGGGSRVVIVTDVTLSGTAAQFGRPVVQDVSRQLTARFAGCLQTKLQTMKAPSDHPAGAVAPAVGTSERSVAQAQAVSGLSLLLRAVVSPLTSFFRRGR